MTITFFVDTTAVVGARSSPDADNAFAPTTSKAVLVLTSLKAVSVVVVGFPRSLHLTALKKYKNP